MAVLSLNANFLLEFLLFCLIKRFSKYSDNIVTVRFFDHNQKEKKTILF